jgi:hypothetical protein
MSWYLPEHETPHSAQPHAFWRVHAPVRFLPLLIVALLLAAPAARAEDPIDHSKPPAPDGMPMCAQWVHDEYTVERGGRPWATWHPPRNPRYDCAFGHEHGSNPRAFRYFRRTGMPAFGPVSALAGADEPHAGFKVFLANEDRRGFAWMVVLHQGSGSPRRAGVRFHSLDMWLFRERGGRLVAHTRQMADFGQAVPNCAGVETRESWRLLPVPGCRPTYEEWATTVNVGGVFRARPAFGLHNPITQFDPADPARIVFNKRSVCGPADPAGWDSRCKGDRRSVRHPRWYVRNRGPSRFRTDAYGRRAERGLLQVVSRRLRVDQRRARDGVENTFIAEQPSDGGIFRAGRGFRPRKGFEFPGYCVLRTN